MQKGVTEMENCPVCESRPKGETRRDEGSAGRDPKPSGTGQDGSAQGGSPSPPSERIIPPETPVGDGSFHLFGDGEKDDTDEEMVED